DGVDRGEELADVMDVTEKSEPASEPELHRDSFEMPGERSPLLRFFSGDDEFDIGSHLRHACGGSHKFFLTLCGSYAADAADYDRAAHFEDCARGVAIDRLEPGGLNPVWDRVNFVRGELKSFEDRASNAL